MDAKQCQAKGGRWMEDKCYMPSSGSSSKKIFSKTVKIGNMDINVKKTALWVFLATIGIAAVMGILAVAGVWGDLQWKILLTTSIIGAAGLITLADFAVFKNSARMTYLIMIVAWINAIAGILDIWNIWNIYEKASMTSAGLLFFGIGAVAALSVYEKYKAITFAGLVSSATGFLLFEYTVISETHFWMSTVGEVYLWKFIMDLGIVTFLAAHAALLLKPEARKPAVMPMRWITIGLMVMLAALIITVVHGNYDMAWQVFAIFGILDVAMTIITPVFNRV